MGAPFRMGTTVTDEKADKDIEAAVAALMELTVRGIPPDVQELLMHGSLWLGIAPGALSAAMRAAMDAYRRS
jgi:hypothetical protein